MWGLTQDAEYEAILDQFSGTMAGGNSDLNLAAGLMDRIQHKLAVHQSNRVVMSAEKSRETALELEKVWARCFFFLFFFLFALFFYFISVSSAPKNPS